ncbi:hypothetical protein [Streptomyces sp. JJ38]|uniref:hypothetical protein n=1 Tax=Streptomyces sp. JJ38 TaxID=2738128 RepID=UPI001C5848B6|nr:hypothetical protein [Streptomyces sp. JJ38]MBW1597400.1 hypothetical protein [Streptomyces sp. JJ38]
MTTAVWSPVVVARLHHVDEWWRDIPEGAPVDGWLGDAVSAAVMNGHGLSKEPRMLLARSPGPDSEAVSVLVGVACDAELISSVYHTDSGRRPLFCFVGWLGPSGADGIPSLDMLRHGFRRWAKETYERAVGPDWETTTSPPWRGYSDPRPAPWGATAVARTGGQPVELPKAEDRGVWLLPEDRAEAYWDSARLSDGPCVLVTGGVEPYVPVRSGLTHLCQAGVAAPVLDGEHLTSGERLASRAESVSGGSGHGLGSGGVPHPGSRPKRRERAKAKLKNTLGGCPFRWRNSRAGTTAEDTTAGPIAAAAKTGTPPDRLPLPPGPLPDWSVVDSEELEAGELFAAVDVHPSEGPPKPSAGAPVEADAPVGPYRTQPGGPSGTEEDET